MLRSWGFRLHYAEAGLRTVEVCGALAIMKERHARVYDAVRSSVLASSRTSEERPKLSWKAAAALVATGAIDHAVMSETAPVRQLLSADVTPPQPLWTDDHCEVAANASARAGDRILPAVRQVQLVHNMDAFAAVAHAGMGMAFQHIVRSAGRAVDVDGEVEIEEGAVLSAESGVATGGLRVRPGGAVYGDVPKTLVEAASGRLNVYGYNRTWRGTNSSSSSSNSTTAEDAVDAINAELRRPSSALRWAMGLSREGEEDGTLEIDIRTKMPAGRFSEGGDCDDDDDTVGPPMDGVAGSTSATVVVD